MNHDYDYIGSLACMPNEPKPYFKQPYWVCSFYHMVSEATNVACTCACTFCWIYLLLCACSMDLKTYVVT